MEETRRRLREHPAGAFSCQWIAWVGREDDWPASFIGGPRRPSQGHFDRSMIAR